MAVGQIISRAIAQGAITADDIGALEITHAKLHTDMDFSSKTVTLPATVRGPATLTIDPAVVGDNTGTLVIAGNLQVDGTTTTINSTTLTVDDKNIVLASGAANSAAADGAGITIDGASATLTYVDSTGNFTFNKSVDVVGNMELKSTDAGSSAGPVIDLVRDSASPAAADYLGQIQFKGDDDGGSQQTYAKISGKIVNPSAGVEYGNLEFAVVSNGSSEIVARMTHQGLFLNTNNYIKFEGSTASTNETILTVVDPTADRTITLPDATGTVPLLNVTNTGNFTASGAITANTTINVGAGGGFYLKQDSSESTIRSESQPIVLQTYASSAWQDRVTVTNAGNVGIGTTNPGGLISVPATASNTPKFRLQSASTNTDFAISSYADANGTYVSLGANHYLNSSGNDAVFETTDRSAFILLDARNAGAVTFGTNSSGIATERMRINSSGNVGIGENDPDTLLHISGAPDNKVITIDQNGRASAIGTYFSSDAIGSRIDFYISNGNTNGDSNNRMSILGSGNVGIGTIGPVSSGYDTGSKKLTVMSTTLNNATSGYLELASRANTNGYNAGAIQFNNFENAGTAGTGTQNRTVGQIRTVITTTDSNAGDDSGGTMEFYTKPEAQALAKTMTISTDDPYHRADVTVDATQLVGDSGTNANAFFSAKAKGNYYAGLDIKSNSGHVGGWIGHWNGSSTSRALQARVGGNGINASDYNAIYIDYLGRVTHPLRPHFRTRGFSGHYYVSSIQSAEANRLRGWKHVDVNRGSHFDNSTGKFTIPVTGDYAFYCTVMFTNPSTMDFHLSFQLNGTTLTANNDHNGGGGGQGHQWNGSNLSYSGYFSANDYVGFSITGGGSTSNTYLYGASVYSVMGGYLL